MRVAFVVRTDPSTVVKANKREDKKKTTTIIIIGTHARYVDWRPSVFPTNTFQTVKADGWGSKIPNASREYALHCQCRTRPSVVVRCSLMAIPKIISFEYFAAPSTVNDLLWILSDSTGPRRLSDVVATHTQSIRLDSYTYDTFYIYSYTYIWIIDDSGAPYSGDDRRQWPLPRSGWYLRPRIIIPARSIRLSFFIYFPKPAETVQVRSRKR